MLPRHLMIDVLMLSMLYSFCLLEGKVFFFGSHTSRRRPLLGKGTERMCPQGHDDNVEIVPNLGFEGGGKVPP